MKNLSARIKQKALEFGFDLCGIAKSRSLDEYEPRLSAWISLGMNDKMEYLSRNIEKRLNPEYLFPGTKSLVVTGLSYYSENMQKDHSAPVLSRYAYGTNYHDVIFEKLERLLDWIKSVEPHAEGRSVVDSAPLLEKAWAKEAGLGWQGRHSVVINKETGSFFFIGSLLLNIGLDYDAPVTREHCGECRLCIKECPTGAINDNWTIDARKCIANLTIENRGSIPEELLPLLGRRIYGCDRCQEVCPWNKKATPNKTKEFSLNEEVAAMSREDWMNLSEEKFLRLFDQSAVGRVKYEQFIRNIKAVTKNFPG
ncbi:MAG: tRNA epoxyqueuosine(34) reductase QueG [Bacteroidales bacterium]